LCSSCVTFNASLLVIVIGQVDINRELVSLLSTGLLASYCSFINDIILCYVILYDANKLVIHSFIHNLRGVRKAKLRSWQEVRYTCILLLMCLRIFSSHSGQHN